MHATASRPRPSSLTPSGRRLTSAPQAPRRVSSPPRRKVIAMAGAAPTTTTTKPVFALDFDGVACDSVGESAASAWIASERLWPTLFADPAVQAVKSRVLEDMRAARPVIETGYENLVQVRCLVEGVPVQAMLDDWPAMLAVRMAEWGLDRGDLVRRFGDVRDEWMARDLSDWLGSNRFYPGAPDALAALKARGEAFIVTTKQARFTSALLADTAGVPFPDDRIFSQTVSGEPKSKVLLKLAAEHPSASGFYFVEDKLATLEKVAAEAACDAWQLFLVDWGYNTEKERERARRNERIRVIGMEEFAGLGK